MQSDITKHGVRGWLTNALDRESSGKGSTPGQSRVKDVFSYSESTVVQTH